MLPLVVLGFGLAAMMLVPMVRRTAWGRDLVPAWASLAVFGAALGVSIVLWALNTEPESVAKTPPTEPDGPPVGPPGSAPTRPPLKPGEPAPPLAAGGWINGEPPTFGKGLVVVDFWASWCPFCKQTAPDIVSLHAKYAPRGVAFVGLSTMPRSATEGYVKQHGIPYPNGFSVPRETVRAFGAANPGGTPIQGYEVAPTLFLVGPDGIVRWCDESARFRHQDPKKTAAELDAAIARELAGH